MENQNYFLEKPNYPRTVDDVLRLEEDRPFKNRIDEYELTKRMPFEKIPFVDKDRFILGRLDELIKIMRVNQIWKDRLEEVGVSGIHDWGDWQKVPIASREDLRQGYTVTKDWLVIPWNAADHKPVSSGGSTGEPIISIYRKTEFQHIGERAGIFWRRNVFDRNEKPTILNLFGTTNGWAGHELVRIILENIPESNISPIGTITANRVARFWINQGATDVVATPSKHLELTRALRDDNPKATYPHIRRIIYGGEFMNPLTATHIKDTFPESRLLSGYSATQANSLAIQVNEREDGTRVMDDINLLEIVNDQGTPVPYGQPGRLIVTRLMGNGDQPLRFDLQDQAILELPDADDPLQARKLKLVGRGGDIFRIWSYDIRVTEFMTAVNQLVTKCDLSKAVEAGQLFLDETGLHLKLAVAPSHQTPSLSPDRQIEIMHEAITNSIGFFESTSGQLKDEVPGTKLTLEFITPDQLQVSPSGKTPVFINKRKGNKN